MSTKQKGKIAEIKVELVAYEKGWTVSRPTSDARYDLVLDDGNKLYRTQVKYAGFAPADGVVQFTANNGGDSPMYYMEGEIDMILVYVPKIDKIVRIEPNHFVGKTTFIIRLAPAKNRQRKGVFLAEEHLF